MVVTLAVVGDIIPPRERGRYQGYFGAVFGVSTVVGPLLGGFFVDNLSWRWIFFVNLPIGLIALGVIATAFHARSDHVKHRIDYLGAVDARRWPRRDRAVHEPRRHDVRVGRPGHDRARGRAVSCSSSRSSSPSAARRADPAARALPNRIFSVTSAIGFVVGFALFGAVTYLPLYLQNVRGHSPTISGLLMTPLMAGVLITSIVSGQLISRYGRYKPFPIAGRCSWRSGCCCSRSSSVDTPGLQSGLYMLVLGLGLGMVMQVLVLAAQNAVPYEYLGVATSGSTLFRSIGGSIGVSIFGAIFANQLAANLAAKLPAGATIPKGSNPEVIKHLPPAVHEAYQVAVTESLHPIFYARRRDRARRVRAHLAAARDPATRDGSRPGYAARARSRIRGRCARRGPARTRDARAPRQPLGAVRAARHASRHRARAAVALALLPARDANADPHG